MATVGFSASEEQKQRIDELAEQFVKENGGNKGNFLAAMVAAYEASQAKSELPGRADEINHVESLLDGLRVAYMASLSMAVVAKENADKAAAAELEKAKAIQGTLQATIDELKTSKAEAEERAAKVDSLQKELETAHQELAEALERAKKAEQERADLSSVFQSQVQELKAKEAAMAADVAQAKEVNKAKAILEQEVKQLEEELTKAKSDAVLASEKAENEKKSAVLDVKMEMAQKLEKIQEEYRQKLLASMTSMTVATVGTSKAKL